MLRIYAAFILLGIFWGSNFIYMKWASALITSGQISLLRVLFGFAPLAVLAWRKGVFRFGQVRYLHHFAMMAAFATAFSYFAMAQGTALLPSGIAGVLGASPALFTCIASAAFLRHERINPMMCSGVLLGIVGIALISRPWSSSGTDDAISMTGVAWMLVGSLVFGLSYIYVRRYLSAIKLPPLAIVTWQMGLALSILACLTDLHGIGRILHDWKAATGLVFGLGLLGTGASFLLYYYLLEKLGAVAAASAVYVTPVVALLIGWWVGERVGLLELIAVVMIFGSIALLEFGRQANTRQKTEPVTPPTVRFD
ncbi:Permease of the drug/metabolite transporter (DMT) superfamily [Paraburkholderia caribensis MBA4]|uniref:Permease of the drug/metabolite transporter (DMT) superfamily n=1 Tax=Paraburkholderia caribensis MBA4 TaxID=1323664 RepID=A0A0P0RKQ2_9BURK|nr:DMT family transporter [Paraburkholderia caribensis]ALL69327.1 Permease of the drug/metabolite transporter (DMT) superfamily [Paraburkholderia caribensis MBA4]